MRCAGITYRLPRKLPPYAEALRWAGVEPVPISPDKPLPLDGLDGLLISGGADVNPRLYGEDRHAANEDPDDARDAMERLLLEQALAAGLPVLCICRGMQLFNVARGGTLVQDMDGHLRRGVNEAHRIVVARNTRLGEILGPGDHPVNSRHHQAVNRVGAGLVVSALSDDGWVEGLEMPERRFAVAVQWHPEDLVDHHEEARRLFAAFARALPGRM